MGKVFGVVVIAAAMAGVSCSNSSSSNGGGGLFPTGPSCPGGQPMQAAVSAECESCAESACSNSANETCAHTTCGAYYTCTCGCDAGDTTCQDSCTPSSDCMSCQAQIFSCFEQAAVSSSCASACGIGDGGAPTGSCATLNSCCSNLSGVEVSGCQYVAAMNNASSCSNFLTALFDGGSCH
jgi:hypothetical protein